MEVTKNGQNLLDIALQATGDASSALALAIANGLCLTDDLEVEQTIEVPADIDGDANVRAFYRERNIHPATGVTKTDESTSPFEGIEYWGIEIDFIVS